MSSSVKVSIITPSLNQGAFLEETIKSVLSQDCPNMEYFIIDGGSSDNTIDILKKYAGRLRWISEPDKGQADAINKGMATTTGDIVAWINSDDVYTPGAVRQAVTYFEKNPNISMVYGKSYFTNPQGKIVGHYPTGQYHLEKFAMSNFICQPSTFFRRSAFEKAGGLNPLLEYAFDLDLWIRMAKIGEAVYLPKYLAAYRLHENSKTISSEHALKNHAECLEVIFKHYHWAPINRVYGYCYHLVEQHSPKPFRQCRAGSVLLGLLLSLIKYLQLNRGVELRDIKALNMVNLKKLAIPWHALYQKD